MSGGAGRWFCSICASSARAQNRSGASNITRQRRYSTRPSDDSRLRQFRMAVIGSGPAGFYTAYKVLSKIWNAKVDMYEQLPVPYGLVRFGVAPDHPEVKNCEEKFEEVAQNPHFNFIGNISVGDEHGQLPLSTILPHYDAVLFAYGASKDKALGIPGEDNLKGIYSARAFVGWYNGLPEYADLAPDLTQGEDAVIIGQGNVAMDVARILLQDPNVLRSTDITTNAIETLQKSKVKRVRVIGRRGPMQAAYTIKELRELMKLPLVAFHPADQTLLPEKLKGLERAPKRLVELIKKGSETTVKKSVKSWSLDFCLSPKSFEPDNNLTSQLGAIKLEKTSLLPDVLNPEAKAGGTGEILSVPASMAFRSIGYKSEALPGSRKMGIPFNNRLGIIPNDELGRVIEFKVESNVAKQIPGMYCAGWVKRGPTGVIASTMQDAFATAEVIAEDWISNVPFMNGNRLNKISSQGWNAIKDEAEERGCRRVSWDDWKKIDRAEREKGRLAGKEREKFTSIKDMLAVLD